jgi:hypothetical protein
MTPHSLVLVLFLSVAPLVHAQQPASADTTVTDPRFDLLRGITLTPQQKVRTDSINAAFAEHVKKVESTETSAGGTVTKVLERSIERRRALRAVLTAQQQLIFDRNYAELQAWMRREAHHRR